MEEIIVRYVGQEEELFGDGKTQQYHILLGGYAILTVTEKQRLSLQQNSNIIYLEQPEDLYVEEDKEELEVTQIINEERRGEICLETPTGETGKGVIMAYLDSGIDYKHPEFRKKDGSTRILAILDLSGGQEILYTREEIDEALQGMASIPLLDSSGHGTHVAGIGSGNSSVAPESDILVVRLQGGTRSRSNTAVLMRGIDFCIRQARSLQQPIVINISYGNNEGAHNGSSLVEQYLDEVMYYAKANIVVGIGNEGAGVSHYTDTVNSEMPLTVQFAVGNYQRAFQIQIWIRYGERIRMQLLSPRREEVFIGGQTGEWNYELESLSVRVVILEPTPVQLNQQILLSFLPRGEYLEEGLWNIVITSEEGQVPVDLWMPVSGGLESLTGFLMPSAIRTLTIPSSAQRVITVGALDQRFDQVAAFSGRGNTWQTNQIKPDLVAPGVDIRSATIGGGYGNRTGTSMATPFVSGAVALMMEWGVVKGNDLFLYGDKIKAFLRKGARKIPQFQQYPNEIVGYGKLCVRDSFPRR